MPVTESQRLLVLAPAATKGFVLGIMLGLLSAVYAGLLALAVAVLR